MLRYVYGEDLDRFPKLRDQMFRDRALQFKSRLNWDVTVDADGYERDTYDAMNPLYAIWEEPDGSHGGSMRFLPTTGDTMVNDHFLDLTDGVAIQSPFIWECTRFCVAENAASRVSSMLMLAAVEVGLTFYLTDLIGVFDARMVRIYRRLGWEPTVLGSSGTGRDAISVGLWECADAVRGDLLKRSGIAPKTSQQWLDVAFGTAAPAAAMPKAV